MGVIHTNDGYVVSEENPLHTTATTKEVLPVDIQSRFSETIPTHSGVVVAPTVSNDGAWFLCDGYDKLVVRAKSSAALNWEIQIWWSDDNGLTSCGIDFLGGGTANNRIHRMDVGAKYARVTLKNADATTPQTLTGVSYLKG
jgi:hypothetical protein